MEKRECSGFTEKRPELSEASDFVTDIALIAE